MNKCTLLYLNSQRPPSHSLPSQCRNEETHSGLFETTRTTLKQLGDTPIACKCNERRRSPICKTYLSQLYSWHWVGFSILVQNLSKSTLNCLKVDSQLSPKFFQTYPSYVPTWHEGLYFIFSVGFFCCLSSSRPTYLTNWFTSHNALKERTVQPHIFIWENSHQEILESVSLCSGFWRSISRKTERDRRQISWQTLSTWTQRSTWKKKGSCLHIYN